MSETKQQCNAWIWDRRGKRRCAKNAKVQRYGKRYCGIHDPEAEKERLNAKWVADREESERRHAEAAKKQAHADMCMNFHERLVKVLEQYHEFAPSPESSSLLAEISKAAEL